MHEFKNIIALATVLFLVAMLGRAAAQQESAEGELDGWLWCDYGDEGKIYSSLLKRPDGDIAFLAGLTDIREPTRRLCEATLSQLKTDRTFQVLSKQIHDPDWRLRYQATEVLGNFFQPRCVAPLLDVLANDTEPLNRALAAKRLGNYSEDRVKSALSRSLKDDSDVAQAAAFALGGMQVEAAIAPTVDLLRSDRKDIDRSYLARALARYTDAKVRARIVELTKGVSSHVSSAPGDKPSKSAKADELFFRVKLHMATYRLADPIAIDFALENRSLMPARIIPPMTDWASGAAFGVRLERLSEPRMTVLDSEPVVTNEMYAPKSHMLRVGETFLLRNLLSAVLAMKDPGIWPLPEGKYRLTVTFDNTLFPKAEWPARQDEKGQTVKSTDGDAPAKLAGRWHALPVVFNIEGPARTDPADLLEFIGREAGRPALRTSLFGKRSLQIDDHVVCLFGDARLVPLLASRQEGWFLDGMGCSSFFFAQGRYGLNRGAIAGPRRSSTPGDKPVVAGPEGQRAFHDLANIGDRNRHWNSPWYQAENEMKPLESPFAEERAKQAKYILASAIQSFADESNGRCKWQQSFGWGGGMESPVREMRQGLARALAKRVTAAEASDIAVWLIDKDPVLQDQALGSRALCQIESPEKEPIYRRLLAQPHTNEVVLVNILGQVTLHKMTALSTEVRRLCGHYRTAVRTAAHDAAIELGITDLPGYRPEVAFTPWLAAELEDIAAMAEATIPKDAPWKRFNVSSPSPYGDNSIRTESFDGWLLRETGDTYDVLAMTGNRLRLEKPKTKVEPASLEGTATDLLKARNAPVGDGVHSLAGRFSRMGLLTSQFEPHNISAQEALVSAWLYQRGEKSAAAALLFPRIDASSDDRELRQAVQELLGTAYHLDMLTAFADARDYNRALVLARHLSGPLFDGYWYQDRAKEFVEQIPQRRDDFKSFRLPHREDWAELKKKLTRPQQIEYLAKRLRLLKGFQWSQPGGVSYEMTIDDPKDGPVINPYTELRALHLDIADLPTLVPFLADETYTLTYGYWRDFHPARDLHRVNRPVAAIVNEVARRNLAELDAYSAMDTERKRKHIDTILQWCREHGGQTRQQYLLKTLAEAPSWHDFAPAASEAVAKRVPGTLATLTKRFGDFQADGNAGIAKLCCQLDTADAAVPARRWLSSSDPGAQYWAAMILLRHGKKMGEPEGLDVLAHILVSDDGTHYYPGAIGPLLATKSEAAAKLACGILKKQRFNEEPGWICSPVLQRLLMAGRQECLDHLLTRLDSNAPNGGSSGVRNGKPVAQSLVKGDDVALAVAAWHKVKHEYDTLAPNEDRRRQRDELKTWLKGQFELVKAGKEPQMAPPDKIMESAGPFLDSP